jgi:uncharacterized membrane protein YhaH (DUF805 family)
MDTTTPASTPTLPEFELLRPRSWFQVRGTMSRGRFWWFYTFNIFGSFFITSMAEAMVRRLPSLATFGQITLVVISLASIIALTGAMVRRLRENRMHWWPVLATWASFIGFMSTLSLDLTTYELNRQNGTVDAWMAARLPLTEGFGIIFLIVSAYLFFGLARRSPRKT